MESDAAAAGEHCAGRRLGHSAEAERLEEGDDDEEHEEVEDRSAHPTKCRDPCLGGVLFVPIQEPAGEPVVEVGALKRASDEDCCDQGDDPAADEDGKGRQDPRAVADREV